MGAFFLPNSLGFQAFLRPCHDGALLYGLGMSNAMLCSAYAGTPPDHYIVEPKIDGVRVIIRANSKTKQVAFFSRNGLKFTSLNWLKPAVLNLISKTRGDLILDGEVVSGTCQQTIADLFRKNHKAKAASIYLFDVIKDEVWKTRRQWMVENLQFNDDIKLVLQSELNADIPSTYKKFRALGFEGAVIKDVESEYFGGEVSEAWQKMKEKDTYDLKIVGFREGKVLETLGSLEVSFKGKIYPVGAGFTASERAHLWATRDSLISKTVEVACQELTKSGAIRHPTFVRIRQDK